MYHDVHYKRVYSFVIAESGLFHFVCVPCWGVSNSLLGSYVAIKIYSLNLNSVFS
jgi:hypothetical protein